MKTGFKSRAIMIALCLCFSTNIISQTLETYSGSYELIMPQCNCGYPHEGKATYQYRKAPNGSRIFEGDFKFIDDENHYYAIGKFKNNHQVGRWEWGVREEEQIIINFNEYGHPEGAVKYKNCEFTIKNGVIRGDVVMRDNGIEIKGKLNYEGDPIGKWTIRDPKYPLTTRDYDDKYTSSWYYSLYDLTTGDRKSTYVNYRYYNDRGFSSPEKINSHYVYEIKRLCLQRSSTIK